MKAEGSTVDLISESSAKAESDPDFLERLKKIASIAGSVNALAKASRLSQGGLQRYMKGGEPTRPALLALATAVDVNLLWLACGQGPMRNDSVAKADDEFELIPISNAEVSAGHGGNSVDEAVQSHMAFRRDWLRNKGLQTRHLTCVHARGDSMEPLICNGNMLLVDTESTAIAEGIYVLHVDEHLFVKRLQRQMDGSVRIISENPAYETQIVPKNALNELRVIGRVVWCARDM